jgi:hypothetical protein
MSRGSEQPAHRLARCQRAVDLALVHPARRQHQEVGEVEARLHEPPPPIVGRRPAELAKPSAELCEVIERCLRKDPAGRYANAGDLRAALEQTPEHGHWRPARVDTHRPLPDALPPVDGGEPRPDVQTRQGRATK